MVISCWVRNRERDAVLQKNEGFLAEESEDKDTGLIKSLENTEKNLEKYLNFGGLKLSKEAVWVISLSAANVFMLMLLCWYKKSTDDKVDSILED